MSIKNACYAGGMYRLKCPILQKVLQNDIVIEVNRDLREDIMRFGFRQMKNEDISVFIDEMFEILASNMSAVAPTGNSYDEDYKTWSESAV